MTTQRIRPSRNHSNKSDRSSKTRRIDTICYKVVRWSILLLACIYALCLYKQHFTVYQIMQQEFQLDERVAVKTNTSESVIQHPAFNTTNLSTEVPNDLMPSHSTEVMLGSNTSMSSRREKKFTHFMSHIPKTGSTSALRTMSKLILHSYQYKKLSESKRFRPCNMVVTETSFFTTRYRDEYKGAKCTMWMSEDHWTSAATNTYTILRNPMHHVLSQYFHCTESTDRSKMEARGRNNKMANVTMDDWLEAWTAALRKQQVMSGTPTFHQVRSDEEKQHILKGPKVSQLNSRYDCYNPINMMSRYTRHSGSNDRATLKKTLKQKYKVIGDMSQLDKSICLITIEYTGWLPQECNCTYGPSSNNSNTTTHHHQQHHRSRKNNPKVMGTYNVDHGVTHHGATYQATQHQQDLINELTQIDQMIYKVGQELFAEKIAETEALYNIKLCDKIILQ